MHKNQPVGSQLCCSYHDLCYPLVPSQLMAQEKMRPVQGLLLQACSTHCMISEFVCGKRLQVATVISVLWMILSAQCTRTLLGLSKYVSRLAPVTVHGIESEPSNAARRPRTQLWSIQLHTHSWVAHGCEMKFKCTCLPLMMHNTNQNHCLCCLGHLKQSALRGTCLMQEVCIPT